MRYALSSIVAGAAVMASPAIAAPKPPLARNAPIITAPVADPAPTPATTLHLDLSTGGSVVIQLRPDKAPKHVERVTLLTRAGFYDGVLFHRVIDGFMAQTGDPKGTGEGGSSLPDLKAEFNDLPHLRGTVSMARAAGEDSANSQFFICFMPVLRLDGKYTPFGRVLSGMPFVDAVERGEPPANPSRIVHAWIEADGPNAARITVPGLVIAPPVTPIPAAQVTPALAPVAALPVAKPAVVRKRARVR
jgi:cyclophilin family peptidyl-prolyl cis-trans isomerase